MTQDLTKTPYDLLGGKLVLLSLVDRFYFFMDTLPEAAGIRALHAADLDNAREKLFKFLSGWLGGPDLYISEFGHPRLRRRHFPFAIGQLERDQWMLCMNKALDEINIECGFRENIRAALQQLATHMINQAS